MTILKKSLIEVFEHIPLELCNDFAKATVNLLKEDGVMYLTVPHKNKQLSYKHFQHFNYESLIKYFQDDFEIQKVEYIQRNSKFLNMLMSNNIWIINNLFYKKKYFFAEERNCGRIYLKLRKK